MKILEFLQSSSGELSSKRLGYLSTIPASILGTIFLCNKLINSGHPEHAVTLWNGFLFFSAILGGFVSFETIPIILRAWKGTDQNLEQDNIPKS